MGDDENPSKAAESGRALRNGDGYAATALGVRTVANSGVAST